MSYLDNQLAVFEGKYEVMILFPSDVKFPFKGDFLIRAKDLASALEYDPTNGTKHVIKFCKDDQVFLVKNSDLSISPNQTNRKLHNTGEQFITNLGLNRVFGKSGQPKAELFQDWLYEEVIPSIQKHGGYLTPEKIEEVLLNPDTIIDLAQRLKQANEEKAKLTAQIEADKPKVIFADSVAASKTSILIGDLAKLLKQNGYETGQKRLFARLRDEGYLIKRRGADYNMPTQKSMEMGLFEIKETVVTHSDGHISINRTPKVTGKGQIYFINKYVRRVEAS